VALLSFLRGNEMLDIKNGWTWVTKQLESMVLTGEGVTPAAAIPDADGTNETVVVNAILAVLRDRGLIATV